MNTSRMTTASLPGRTSELTELGDRIRSLRRKRGVSRADLEKSIGLRRSYISRVEGQQVVPSLATLNRIAKALDVELSELFSSIRSADETSSIDDLCAYRAVPLNAGIKVRARPVLGNRSKPLPYAFDAN